MVFILLQGYDHKTDVFSSGCVVHELCNLVRTFQSTNIVSLVYNIVRGKIAPVHEMVLCWNGCFVLNLRSTHQNYES
jgi:hypothetical protein